MLHDILREKEREREREKERDFFFFFFFLFLQQEITLTRRMNNMGHGDDQVRLRVLQDVDERGDDEPSDGGGEAGLLECELLVDATQLV